MCMHACMGLHGCAYMGRCPCVSPGCDGVTVCHTAHACEGRHAPLSNKALLCHATPPLLRCSQLTVHVCVQHACTPP